MAARCYTVLFLSTGNAARSIIAEALLNHLGGDRFKAFSAGSHPVGEVHRHTLELLEREQIPAIGLRSKSWDEFGMSCSRAMDFVLTVCDRAASLTSPLWPGDPLVAHLGVADPMTLGDTSDDRRRAFDLAFRDVSTRVERFIGLPFDLVDSLLLHRQLKTIGHLPRQLGAQALSRPGR
jgi:arsenate reductase